MDNKNITIKKSQAIGNKQDTIRMKGNNIKLSLNVFNGKQGEFFLCFCPSLNISGYGKTEKEAEEFIKHEMIVFCEDLADMKSDERYHYLLSLGFNQEKLRNKNFSKAYVDENGRLQDFDEGTVERKILQSV
jgi:hypothetical protein